MSTISVNGTKYYQANSSDAGAQATGSNAIAAGPNALASGANSIALGNNATASGTNSVVIGTNSQATAANSVALGSNSVADQANTVSVGSADNTRRITNVAPGINGTDAVNVSQLNNMSTNAITQANNYTDSAVRTAVKDANAGIAAAMAFGSPPSIPGHVTTYMGVANYKGQTAASVTARITSRSGRWAIEGGVSAGSRGSYGIKAGYIQDWGDFDK